MYLQLLIQEIQLFIVQTNVNISHTFFIFISKQMNVNTQVIATSLVKLERNITEIEHRQVNLENIMYDIITSGAGGSNKSIFGIMYGNINQVLTQLQTLFTGTDITAEISGRDIIIHVDLNKYYIFCMWHDNNYFGNSDNFTSTSSIYSDKFALGQIMGEESKHDDTYNITILGALCLFHGSDPNAGSYAFDIINNNLVFVNADYQYNSGPNSSYAYTLLLVPK